jgi:hypothetical protein
MWVKIIPIICAPIKMNRKSAYNKKTLKKHPYALLTGNTKNHSHTMGIPDSPEINEGSGSLPDDN